jgi:hypothetical protein
VPMFLTSSTNRELKIRVSLGISVLSTGRKIFFSINPRTSRLLEIIKSSVSV